MWKQLQRRHASVQDLLLLEDIVDGVVCLRGGACRAVLEAQSISFALRSPAEQEAIMAGYRSFLNAMSYPLQMLVRILPKDIERYLAALRFCTAGQDSATLHRLALDHEAFLRRLAKTTTLLERRFYVVIPAGDERNVEGGGSWWSWGERATDPPGRGPQAAARLLSLRCEEVTQGFAAFGVTVRRLDADALLEVWTSFLRGEPSVAQSRAASFGPVELARTAKGEEAHA